MTAPIITPAAPNQVFDAMFDQIKARSPDNVIFGSDASKPFVAEIVGLCVDPIKKSLDDANEKMQKESQRISNLLEAEVEHRRELDEMRDVLQALVKETNVDQAREVLAKIQVLKEKISELTNTSSAVADKDNEIRVLNEKITELTNTSSAVADKDNDIRVLNDKITELTNTQSAVDQRVADKDTEIRKLNEKITELTNTQSAVADKDNQICKLNEKVIDLTNTITELKSAPSQSSQSADDSLSPSHRFPSQEPEYRARQRVLKLGGQATKHPHVNHLRRSELGVEIAQKQLEQKRLTQQLTQSYPERQAEKQKERDHAREQNKAKRQLEKATESQNKALKLAREAQVKQLELEITKLTDDAKKVRDEARDLKQEAETDVTNAEKEQLLTEAKELEAKAAEFDALLLKKQDALSQIA